MEVEKRVLKVDFRAVEEDGKRKFVGMPIVYDRVSENLGWFTETIAKGAASEALRSSDPRALYGHNSDSLLPLGRKSAGTLRAIETDAGVEIEVDPPDTQFARDLATAIERGDIQDMSFAFTVADDEWSTRDGKEHRTVTKIKELFDFSFVAYPAYSDTTVALRSLDAHKKDLEIKAEDRATTAEDEDLEIDLITIRTGDLHNES